MLWQLLCVIFMIFQSLGEQEQFVQFHFLCFLLCKYTILKVLVKENEVPTEKNFSSKSIFATKVSYISN